MSLGTWEHHNVFLTFKMLDIPNTSGCFIWYLKAVICYSFLFFAPRRKRVGSLRLLEWEVTMFPGMKLCVHIIYISHFVSISFRPYTSKTDSTNI